MDAYPVGALAQAIAGVQQTQSPTAAQLSCCQFTFSAFSIVNCTFLV